jgi:hypothetical protein
MWACERATVSTTRREIHDTENVNNLTRPAGQLLLRRTMQEGKKQDGYLEVEGSMKYAIDLNWKKKE